MGLKEKSTESRNLTLKQAVLGLGLADEWEWEEHVAAGSPADFGL